MPISGFFFDGWMFSSLVYFPLLFLGCHGLWLSKCFLPSLGASWPSDGLDDLWSKRGLLFKLGARIRAKWVASVLPRGPLFFRMLV